MTKRRKITGNPVAQSPLLKKGGAHSRIRSGQRQKDKRKLSRELNNWWNARGSGGPGDAHGIPCFA